LSARRSAPKLLALVVLLPTVAGGQQTGARAAHDTGNAIRALGAAAKRRTAERATERYDPIFRKYTKRYFGIGYDWRVFKAQGMAESDLHPDATSHVGARGIMQLMPSTYKLIASRRTDFGAINDPEWNIAAGIMHDRYLWRLWEKDVTEAERRAFMFGAYNAGEGTIKRARSAARAASLEDHRWQSIERVAPGVQRWRYRETLGYVKKIEENYRRFGAAP
jgi:membrane-bound lytic murein transglycosylase F